MPQLHRNTMDIFTTGKAAGGETTQEPPEQLRGVTRQRLPQTSPIPWLTSTLQRDAESATKFCPGGSLGVSSASSPLQRGPGEEKHSPPPVTHLHKDVLLPSPRAAGAEGMNPPEEPDG